MMDELREVLPEYHELMDLYHKQMEKGNYCFNDELHIQAFDIVFCSDYMGFYNECPTLGISTKERVRLAKENEEREKAEEEISQLTDLIDKLNSSLKEVPDLTGISVSHKKYGDGEVTSMDGNRFSICFVDGERRFTLDSIIKGFVSVPDEYKELIAFNDAKLNEIQKVGRRIDELRFKYDL